MQNKEAFYKPISKKYFFHILLHNHFMYISFRLIIKKSLNVTFANSFTVFNNSIVKKCFHVLSCNRLICIY